MGDHRTKLQVHFQRFGIPEDNADEYGNELVLGECWEWKELTAWGRVLDSNGCPNVEWHQFHDKIQELGSQPTRVVARVCKRGDNGCRWNYLHLLQNNRPWARSRVSLLLRRSIPSDSVLCIRVPQELGKYKILRSAEGARTPYWGKALSDKGQWGHYLENTRLQS